MLSARGLQSIAGSIALSISLSVGAAPQLLTVKGRDLLVLDPRNGSERSLATIVFPPLMRVIAVDPIAGRVLLEGALGETPPYHARVYSFDLATHELAPSAFRATRRLDYFYDPKTRALFAFGSNGGEVISVDLASGRSAVVADLPCDNMNAVAFDPTAYRLFATFDEGLCLGVPGEFTEKHLYIADLRTGTVSETPFATREPLGYTFDANSRSLYAFVARSIFSNEQKFIKIELDTGHTEILASLPGNRMRLAVADFPSNHLYFEEFPDYSRVRLFEFDITTRQVRPTGLEPNQELEYVVAPVVADIPALNRIGVLILALVLGFIGLLISRHAG